MQKPEYRYTLERDVGEPSLFGFVKPRGTLLWVMLNPSTADEKTDDPTIRRCIGFTRYFGYNRLVVVNLFAARATNPKDLYRIIDPVGWGNMEVIRREAEAADGVVCAWGAAGKQGDIIQERMTSVRWLLDEIGVKPWCLGRTDRGFPRHPLYVDKAQPLEDYPVAGAQ